MKPPIGLFTVLLATSAFAQGAPPMAGKKLPVQAQPQASMGCKLVGTVRWAGHCVGLEIRGTTTTTEPQSLSERAIAVIPAGRKE